MQLILLAGQAGVGKTTLAEIIANRVFELGLTPHLLSFAGSLKAKARDRGYDKETHPKEYREFCQEYGAIMRKEDPDYWIKEFENQVLDIIKKENELIDNKYWEQCIIIDDCRYLNELAIGKKYKGSLVFLSYGKRRIKGHEEDWRNHESETLAKLVDAGDKDYVDIFNQILINGGTLDDLKEKVHDLIPLWCNIRLDERLNSKRIRSNGTIKDLEEALDNLVDLLFFSELDDDDEETE